MKKISSKARKLAILIACMAFVFNAVANDMIHFTWEVTASTFEKSFGIMATDDKIFTVSWGDGVDSTYTGNGNNHMMLYHTYTTVGTYAVSIVAITPDCRFTYLACYYCQLSTLDVSNSTALIELYCSNNTINNLTLGNNTELSRFICANNQLSNLNLSKCTALTYFNCSENQLDDLDVSNNAELLDFYCFINQLVHLDVSNNVKLTRLDCYNNHLSLSDLYVATKITQGDIGSHRLMPQTIGIGEVLFSDQSIFDGIYTDYVVIKDCFAAPQTDYTIVNGTLIFHTTGNYSVTMTNAAIVSSFWWNPIQIFVDINVSNVGIVGRDNYPSVQIYPNPTTGKLQIENGELRIESVAIFDMTGKCYLTLIASRTTETTFDISELPAGVYFVKIRTAADEVVKKVVKK